MNSSTGIKSGLELEVQTVNPSTGETNSKYGMDLYNKRQKGDRIVNELFLCQVETITDPHDSITGVLHELEQRQKDLYRDFSREGLCAIHTGTHPRETGAHLPTTPGERYSKFIAEFGPGIRDSLITGVHINIDTKHPVEMTYLLLKYVPISIAINPNAPFWAGKPSGYLDLRCLRWAPLFKRVMFPPLGMKHATDYTAIVNTLMQHDLIDGPSSIWWLVRPKLDLGVVEIRTPSTPLRLSTIGAYLALFVGLVYKYEQLLDQGMKLPNYSVMDEIMRDEAFFSSAREGRNGRDWDYQNQKMIPMEESINKAIEFIADTVDTLGIQKQYADLKRILAEPSDAEKQLMIYKKSGNNINSVVEFLMEESTQFFN